MAVDEEGEIINGKMDNIDEELEIVNEELLNINW